MEYKLRRRQWVHHTAASAPVIYNSSLTLNDHFIQQTIMKKPQRMEKGIESKDELLEILLNRERRMRTPCGVVMEDLKERKRREFVSCTFGYHKCTFSLGSEL